MKHVLNQGSSFEGNVSAREDISIVKHELKIPKAEGTYAKFVDSIRISEKIFKEALV